MFLTVRGSAAAAFAALAMLASPHVGEPALAQSSSLSGSWSGGGLVTFPSGDRERASCRATFRSQGGGSFSMYAVCATSSARVVQTANLSNTGGNTYSGSFFNTEHGVSGAISIRVTGNRLSASLQGGGGSARISLRR